MPVFERDWQLLDFRSVLFAYDTEPSLVGRSDCQAMPSPTTTSHAGNKEQSCCPLHTLPPVVFDCKEWRF
jgi:hypothetical protein